MGILGIVQIVFIILKLANVVDWSWWVTLSPIFAEIILYILLFIFKLKLLRR